MRHLITFSLSTLALLAWMPLATAAGVCDDDNVRERLCDPKQKSVFSRYPFNLQRVWLMMAVFDADERTTTPAIVDIGFLDDGEVRAPNSECFVNYVPSKFAHNIDCAANIYGEYDGILLATGKDAYKTHGNNMKNIIAATLNDGGAAGVAGQVAVPNLYRLDDVQSYLFELGPTIRQAVDDGSSVINISGGFPCIVQLNTPPNGATPNLCTSAGRWQFCNTARLVSAMPALSTLLCATGELEGDLVNNIAAAANYATAAGVPIVASAGNISTEWLTSSGVDLTGIVNWTAANSDAADWGIIPATVGPVIAAGAAGTKAPYANQDFHGPRVNVWAPFSDTSPSAAFISGLIALAQAINPDLSPANDDLSADELEDLPQQMRDLLMATAHTPDELSATCKADKPDCMTDPTGERRNLVHPYRFLRAAAQGALPDFETLGYTDTFDSSRDDHEPANDAWPDLSTASPSLISAMTTEGAANSTATGTGTIFHVPGPTPLLDVDAHILTLAGSGAAQTDLQLELTYLTGYGDLTLTSPQLPLTLSDTRVNPVETTLVYRTRRLAAGASILVKVAGVNAADDNLYKLSIVRGLDIRTRADRFDQSNGNNNSQHPDHNNIDAAATELALTVQPFSVVTNTSRWSFSVDELSIHSTNDQDHFTFNGPAAPTGTITYEKHLTINTDNPMIRLLASTNGGEFRPISDSGVYYYDDQTLTLRAEPRLKGLVLDYNLSGSLTMQPMEYNAIPDKAMADLERFIDNMRYHVDGYPARELGCVECMNLGDQGLIEAIDGHHAVARYGRIPHTARSANYVLVEKTSQITLTLESDRADNVRLYLFDTRGKRITRSARGNPQLSATLEPGAYVVVTAGGRRGEQRYRYTLRREPR